MLTAIVTVIVVCLCFALMFGMRRPECVCGTCDFLDCTGACCVRPACRHCASGIRVSRVTRGNAPGTGTLRTVARRERRKGERSFEREQARRTRQRIASTRIFGPLVVCLTLSACFNAAGQFDGAATMKASKAAAHLICAAVGALDALPDSTTLLLHRDGGVRVESSGGAQ